MYNSDVIGSREKICEEPNRARSVIKGVRSNVAIIILGLIVVISFTSINIYLLMNGNGSVKSGEIEIQKEEDIVHTVPGQSTSSFIKNALFLII